MMRIRVTRIVESQLFQRFIITVILVNAVVLGLETSKSTMDAVGPLLKIIDDMALGIFVVEIGLKLYARRWCFFKNPWNIFDFIIVGIALAPAGETMSVLRAFRVLRALRLMSMVPKMRSVVQALLGAIPAMGSVIALLSLVYYVFAVMATKLFGAEFEAWFGTIGASMYSLFQIMTLESWSMGIVRPVMELFPWAWVFFVPFILCTTFAVLNLFVAIIVNSMQEATEGDVSREHIHDDIVELAKTVARLEAKIDALQQAPISVNTVKT